MHTSRGPAGGDEQETEPEEAAVTMSSDGATSERGTGADPGLGPDQEAARRLYERFLPPEPFRGIDPTLYGMRSEAGLSEALAAWHAADRWSSADRDAAHARHHAEAHLRMLAPEAMVLYDEQRGAGTQPALAMAAATFELETQAVMALLDELEVEAAERGLSGRDRDEWVERQVEALTDLDRELPSPGRAAVAIAADYRSLVEPIATPPAVALGDLRTDHDGVDAPIEWPAPVLSPVDAAAFVAEHPGLAHRVEEHGRELLAEHGPRLAEPSPALPAPDSAPETGAARASVPTSHDVAGSEVGGLLGYILSYGTRDALVPPGDSADRLPAEQVDLEGPGSAAPAHTDLHAEPERLEGPSLDW